MSWWRCGVGMDGKAAVWCGKYVVAIVVVMVVAAGDGVLVVVGGAWRWLWWWSVRETKGMRGLAEAGAAAAVLAAAEVAVAVVVWSAMDSKRASRAPDLKQN